MHARAKVNQTFRSLNQTSQNIRCKRVYSKNQLVWYLVDTCIMDNCIEVAQCINFRSQLFDLFDTRQIPYQNFLGTWCFFQRLPSPLSIACMKNDLVPLSNEQLCRQTA